ncbi:MAG: ABC transporter ATP-binding protein [Pyrinomonadaceae bacterium]
MRKLSRLQNSMEQALAAARHVREVMDEKLEMHEKPDALPLQPLKHAFELRDVHFDYGIPDAPVLCGINLRVDAGAMVALVGESGSGKSTLTKLLMRFHDPLQGSILWDDTDLRDATTGKPATACGAGRARCGAFQRHCSLQHLFMVARTPPMLRLKRQPEWLMRTTLLPSFPLATKRLSASAASFFPAASDSAWQ